MALRTEYVAIRFSKEELEELDRRRGAVQRGTFLRNLFLGKREPRKIPEPNQLAYQETARWASNLNQIARQMNGADAVSIDAIRRTLAGFRQALLGLRDDEK